MEKRREAIAEAALRALRAKSGASEVLTNLDYLSLVMERREREHLPGLPTEGALHRFCAVATVCKAWHEAVAATVARRVVLRHGQMFRDCPRALVGFTRPTFLSLSFDEEKLLVADQHKLSIVPVPPPSSDDDLPGPPAQAKTSALGTLGTPDGSGGSSHGELYHPHGMALSKDGDAVYVADRSNQIVTVDTRKSRQ